MTDGTEAVRARWDTSHDRGAHDYTDEGCRILAEAAFRDIATLLARIEVLEAELKNEQRALRIQSERVAELLDRGEVLEGALKVLWSDAAELCVAAAVLEVSAPDGPNDDWDNLAATRLHTERSCAAALDALAVDDADGGTP